MKSFRNSRVIEARRLLADEFFLRRGWIRLDGPRGPMYVNPEDPAHRTPQFRATVEAMGYSLAGLDAVEEDS